MSKKVQKRNYDKITGKIIEPDSMREYNKERIFKFIAEHKGVSEPEIRRKMGCSSKQTTYNYLNPLLSENRVYRKNKKYFAYISGPNSINAFARNIRDASIRLIDADLIEPSEKIIKFLDTQSVTSPYGPLLKNTSGINVSNDFCETKFVPKKDLNEKCMFEFVNRIGSIMAYMFIESLRPIESDIASHTTKSQDKTSTLVSIDFIHIAINLDDIFRRFYLLFKQTGLLKDIPDPRYSQEEKPLSFPRLGKADFDSLSEIFKRVYPNIYEGLENFWPSVAKAWLDIQADLARADGSCYHKWDKTFIYKYNKSPCYLCRNCHLLVDYPVKTNPKERYMAAAAVASKNDSSHLAMEQRDKVFSDYISDYAAKIHDQGYNNNNGNVNDAMSMID